MKQKAKRQARVSHARYKQTTQYVKQTRIGKSRQLQEDDEKATEQFLINVQNKQIRMG